MAGRKASAFRVGYPIVGYIGPNGSGKSLMAVQDVCATLREGKPVLSTVRLLDWEDPRRCDLDAAECDYPSHPDHGAAHPLWRPLRSWGDLIDVEDCDVLMDEVTGVANARDGATMPSEVQNLLMQLRRKGVQLRWTAPSWARADKLIRETTQVAVLCRGWLPRRVAGSRWRTNQWVQTKAIDARLLDDITQGVRVNGPAMMRSWARVASIPERDAYATLDHVLSLPVAESGRCPWCTKRRRTEYCDCHAVKPRRGAGAGRGAPQGDAQHPTPAGGGRV